MTKIALVDDDFSIRRSISRLLRSHGYECVAYESAESALADPGLMKMSCLLIDIELFGMDGFELRDRLRDLGSRVPHIFVTAHSESDIPEWASRMGDSHFLTKPVEERLLLTAIESLSLRKGGLPAA
jgi:FixJ family two-component response regulator